MDALFEVLVWPLRQEEEEEKEAKEDEEDEIAAEIKVLIVEKIVRPRAPGSPKRFCSVIRSVQWNRPDVRKCLLSFTLHAPTLKASMAYTSWCGLSRAWGAL